MPRTKSETWLETMPAMLHSIDAQGRLIAVSNLWLSKLGYGRDEVIGRPSTDFLTPESRDYAVKTVIPEFFRTGRVENIEYRMQGSDGRIIDVLLSAVLENSGSDGECSSLAVITDVTERKVAERRLAQSEARYRLLAEHSADMMFQLDRALVRRYVSPSCRDVLGYEQEELVAAKPLGLVHPDDAANLSRLLKAVLRGRADRQTIVYRMRHRRGHWIWVESQIRAHLDPESGAPIGLVGAMRDISVRKSIEDQLAEANRRLESLVRRDALTGLANRREFDESLLREQKRCRRIKKALGLLMIDVDYFKSFNDHYGHPSGDETLRRIGRSIAEMLFRPGDLAARYGGEEFVVLLPDADEDGAATVANRILQAVQDLAIPHEISPHRLVTVSVGIAASEPVARVAKHLLTEFADRALYQAKRLGRNTTVRASALPAKSEECESVAA